MFVQHEHAHRATGAARTRPLKLGDKQVHVISKYTRLPLLMQPLATDERMQHTRMRTQWPHTHFTDDSPLGTLHVPPGGTPCSPAWLLPLGQLPAQSHGPVPAVDEE
jgi:hypothetical protein